MLLSEIFEGGVSGLFKGVKDIIGTFKADPLEVLRLQQAIDAAELQATTAMSQAQTRINEIEAGSSDKFNSRWRPFIGWVCGGAFAYQFVAQPFMLFLLAVAGQAPLILPVLDWSSLSVVLMGMLGLGTLHTYEKIKH
jgi:holin (3TMs family)